MTPFSAPAIPLTLPATESQTLTRLLTLHFAFPLAYPLAGAYFEELFASATGSMRETRKLLFDIILDQTGWSLKTLQRSNISDGAQFELVIQRCNIISRQLPITSPPQALGDAAVNRFNDWAQASLAKQQVSDPRSGFLLRKKNTTDFKFFQQRYNLYSPSQVTWQWANAEQKSLMGFVGSTLIFRWYRSGTQLFGVYRIPAGSQSIQIVGKRATLDATLAFFETQGVTANVN